MDKSRHHTKGEYQAAIEKAKDMLTEGCPLIEVINKTQLGEEDVLEVKRKMDGLP